MGKFTTRAALLAGFGGLLILILNVAGNLGHHVDFLEGLEFRGEDQGVGEIARDGLGDGN